MRGNSQNGGQTTKSLLIKPQCSGVPIQQAVSLSSSFPRHCLLFVCAFFREIPESAGAEGHPLPPPPAYKTAPASCYGNRGGSFALGALFQALTQNLARGLLVSPAYAGKSAMRCRNGCACPDHPRVCGERATRIAPKNCGSGSPPRMRGKARCHTTGRTLPWDHPRVCGEKLFQLPLFQSPLGSPPRMRGKD